MQIRTIPSVVPAVQAAPETPIAAEQQQLPYGGPPTTGPLLLSAERFSSLRKPAALAWEFLPLSNLSVCSALSRMDAFRQGMVLPPVG